MGDCVRALPWLTVESKMIKLLNWKQQIHMLYFFLSFFFCIIITYYCHYYYHHWFLFSQIKGYHTWSLGNTYKLYKSLLTSKIVTFIFKICRMPFHHRNKQSDLSPALKQTDMQTGSSINRQSFLDQSLSSDVYRAYLQQVHLLTAIPPWTRPISSDLGS